MMSSYLSLLFFTLVIIWCSATQANEDEEIKVLKNFGENLFRELNQFDSFPDKDSDAINVQNHLEPVLFSRRRRSFPDKPGEQQAGEFSEKINPDGTQNNPNDVFPDLSPDREESNPPETNALISEQIMNRSSDQNNLAVQQSQMVQKSEQSQDNVAGQQVGINSPVKTQSNLIGQQQPLVKAESNVQEPVQPAYNNAPQPPAQVQNNVAQQQSAPSLNDLTPQQQLAPSQKVVAQQQSAPSQKVVAQQQSAPLQNNLAQQQSAPSQKIVAQQQSAPSQNNLAQQQLAPSQKIVAQQQSAPSQKIVAQQQSAPSQNNLAQQQSAPSQNNLAQQQSAPSQNNLAQQQSAPSQKIIDQQQSAPSQKVVAQQQSAPSQKVAASLQKDVVQQQLAPSQNNGLQQPVQANNVNGQQLQNGLAEQQMPVNSNLGQQQQPSVQDQSNDLAHDSEQNSVLSSTNQKGQSKVDQNSLPLNQPNYPVVDPHEGQQIIDNGGLYADRQSQQIIGNGGLSADQQKPAFIKGNDQPIADKQPSPTNKPNSPSEFDMINKLHPAYVTGNKPNVKPPGYQPKVYVTSQAVRPGQISVTPSKVDSLSRTPFFMVSTLKNIPKEPEHSQESGKPVSDDGWYYNQEIDDSLHQGVTESEKHAGKQMLMSAHHFDIPLGAFAGAKMFNNDLWQKNRKQYLMNKKSETFEPMSMALFYSWIALATLAVLAILTVFRHRHKVTGYVYDLRHWHNGGYVEEGRRLLHNAYA